MILNYEKTIVINKDKSNEKSIILQKGMYFHPSDDWNGYLIKNIEREYGKICIYFSEMDKDNIESVSKRKYAKTHCTTNLHLIIILIERYCTGEYIIYDIDET